MPLRFPSTLIFLLALLTQSTAQSGYTSWFTGDTTDVQAEGALPGILLAGGGGDNDPAMQWMLSRAAGGDVVIIRASGSDGYNDYFFSELEVMVNSVETIRFDNADAASDEYVIRQIRNAECLFIAGGDQYDYYRYWKDNAIGEAINYLINEKQVTVGGTSAGMAILSQCYYTPSGGSLTADEALNNPFHPDYEILGRDDFLQVPYMQNTVTDTHYEQRERPGRHVGMMARIAQEYDLRSFGIACNEYTAVAIDETGIARAFGDYPEYDEDFVFFLQANCQEDFLPEVMQAGQPLTWNRGQSAVKVYKVPARPDGAFSFDLNDWQSGEGGEWQNWYVKEGELFRIPDTSSDCAELLNATSETIAVTEVYIFPNPVGNEIFLQWPADAQMYGLEIRNVSGKMVWQQEGEVRRLWVAEWPAGLYTMQLYIGEQVVAKKLIKQ